MAKSTKAEVARRVDAVLEIRLAGAVFADIRRYASENQWDVTDRQLERYIAASDKLMAKDFERGRKRRLIRHIAQRRTLYARAFADGDWRTALAVVRDEAELEALYPDPKDQKLCELQQAINDLLLRQSRLEGADPAGAPEPG
jgi:hypothetical protein